MPLFTCCFYVLMNILTILISVYDCNCSLFSCLNVCCCCCMQHVTTGAAHSSMNTHLCVCTQQMLAFAIATYWCYTVLRQCLTKVVIVRNCCCITALPANSHYTSLVQTALLRGPKNTRSFVPSLTSSSGVQSLSHCNVTLNFSDTIYSPIVGATSKYGV
jgi:hypothetical protein